ncbi:MAG: ankyrin repeat domain-containing protein [Gammaproteobacteria bacterium]|nr:ankyrin repeat domain-containing protein [Gammaproteobacteria bacterium]
MASRRGALLAAFIATVMTHSICAQTLMDAARAGDSGQALELLKQGADASERMSDGTTALHWAVYNDDEALVTRLLKAGADVNARNDYGSSPLLEAGEHGNVRIIKRLLDAGADVESANLEGQTALMTVARTSHVDAARLLLDRGANVNARGSFRGQTALMWAAAQSQPAMTELLVQRGAEVDARSDIKVWPRQVTAEPRPQNRPSGGLTALLLAAREGCAGCARALVEGGANIDLSDPDNITPLLMATLNARWDAAAYLIDAGANVNKWDTWGRAPLYSTVDYNTVPRGGRPDRPSWDDTTPLEVMSKLLAKGANPNMQLKLFPPYRSLGQDRGGDNMLTIGTTPLIRAAKAGDTDSIKLLLEYNALPNLPNSLGITPMMSAAGLGSTLIDIRARFRNEAQCIAAAQLLLGAGADVNGGRNDGQTALHAAAFWGWTEFARFLVENGAEINAKDNEGNTALDYALGKVISSMRLRQGDMAPHPETAALLQMHGARSFHETSAGEQGT